LTIYRLHAILNHMVELSPAELDGVFHALADPTRRAMLRQLSAQERTVGELARPFAMSLAAAAKHVRVLERAGLLHRTVAGRTHRCRLEPARLRSADDWLKFYQRHWNERFDVLDTLLQGENASDEGATT
jgi:DNA-binding transcriptional ArsR family regulator